MPKWNTISISGYHIAEAGATPVEEVAFTLANAVEYVRAATEAGLSVDEFAPRLSFFFVARTTVLEEVAKFRAARRLWARIMRDEFKARNPRSWLLRFHTQTAGVELTAQQPEVNLVRVTLAALAAVLGGTQSLHTNSFDEAIGLPTEQAARLAVRTQQVLAHETDVPEIVDALGGSYAVERLTDEIEEHVVDLMDQIESLGGATAAIESGFQKAQIEKSAYRVAQQISTGERVVVGVNAFETHEEEHYRPLRIDPEVEPDQLRRLNEARRRRDARACSRELGEVARAAAGPDNVLHPMKRALVAGATLGEICDVLRQEWGTYETDQI